MTRFSSLEFDDAGGRKDAGPDGQIRDEGYFYREALKYYLYGDFELALRNYSRTLEKMSLFFPGWAGQVRMLIELNEYKEALVWTDKALELFPEHPELFSYKAIAYFRDSIVDKAMAFSDNAISKENAGAWPWLARAEIMLKKNFRIAESCISKSLAAAGREKPYFGLEAGRILSRYRYYAQASDYLKKAARDFPKSALIWLELGRCEKKLGHKEAKTILQQSLTLRPDWDTAEKEIAAIRQGFFARLFNRSE